MRRSHAWKGCSVAYEVAYIGIGSNRGDRLGYCQKAADAIRHFQDTAVIRLSSFYETEPLEVSDQEWFINGAAAIRTALTPQELLSACQKVEQDLGRVRMVRYGPRTIDLDLLLYGERIVSTDRLVLPHPQLHLRRFVLVPMVEIAPEAVHPVLHQTMAELLERVQDNHRVRGLLVK